VVGEATKWRIESRRGREETRARAWVDRGSGDSFHQNNNQNRHQRSMDWWMAMIDTTYTLLHLALVSTVLKSFDLSLSFSTLLYLDPAARDHARGTRAPPLSAINKGTSRPRDP
jgi:hypothetical protein